LVRLAARNIKVGILYFQHSLLEETLECLVTASGAYRVSLKALVGKSGKVRVNPRRCPSDNRDRSGGMLNDKEFICIGAPPKPDKLDYLAGGITNLRSSLH
jgi:hypothetical protein